MSLPMLLAGRVALVTGAARGIGRVTALVLAEEGADVAVADVLGEVEDVAAEVRARGRRAAVAVFDIADDEAVRAAVARLREALGPPGILVNNAGIVANVAPVERMTAAAWHREVDVNLSGAFHMIQATIGDMVASRWGRIVNVSSIGGTGGLHHQAAYAASKAGLLGLTKTVALETAEHGITVNAICPGYVLTPLVEKQIPETAKARKLTEEQVIRDVLLHAQPTRKFVTTEEIGALSVFLCTGAAASITGAALPIEGGWTAQ